MNGVAFDWQVLLMGASLGLMVATGFSWMLDAAHDRFESRRRVAVARARSKRAAAGSGFSALPDGNHGENVHTARTGNTTGAVPLGALRSESTNTGGTGAPASMQSTPVGEEKMQVTRNVVLKYSAVAAAVATVTAKANAAIPAGLATAIEAYQADATTALGLMMGAGVVIWGLMKLKSKLGW